MSEDVVLINRAPVLTLWGAVVAEALGYERDTALTLGKALAGLNAQSKGRSLGIYARPELPGGDLPPKKAGLGEEFWVEICERAIPAKTTEDGVRAVIKDKPIDPVSVDRYLRSRFGEDYEAVRTIMEELCDPSREGSWPARHTCCTRDSVRAFLPASKVGGREASLS